MTQDWFEMHDLRTKTLTKTVWIPLLAYQTLGEEGKHAYAGYKEEYFATKCITVSLDDKERALELEWMDVGGSSSYRGYIDNDEYIPIDICKCFKNDLMAVNLVLEQHINSEEQKEWHLHQDFVITLGLLREGDSWVSSNEGYIEVARLTRNKYGEPCRFEVRAEHLKDYLAARGMGLYSTSYWSRAAIAEDDSFIKWDDESVEENTDIFQWKGAKMAIHEGHGEAFGSTASVLHLARTDVVDGEDLPDISNPPTGENTTSSSWEKNFDGRKLFRIDGQIWKNEWIDPAKVSSRVREDETAATIFFIVDEEGTKENKETLKSGGRWLWFKPDVMMALSHRRGGSLSWYTRDTGGVRCSPDYRIHFGMNDLGLINVYAKDIALLPDWQQQIWSGYNVSPEGGVSDELLASQVQASPATTKAPEAFLGKGVQRLNEVAKEVLNITLFKEHEAIPELRKRIHRFRAIDKDGLYSLAKDIARITADSLNTVEIQKIAPPPKGEKWGSLKSLENLLVLKLGRDLARKITASLVGTYELRLADAHLPKTEIDEAFELLNIDQGKPYVVQAAQMIDACVISIFTVIEVIKNWDKTYKG